MKFFYCITVFLLVVAAILGNGFNRVLQFPREASFDHYVLLKPNFTDVEEKISVCSWIKFYQTDGYRYWFSYAAEKDEYSFNHLMFSNHPDGQVNFLSKHLPNTHINFTPYLWQHHCFVWDTVSEHAELFLNGKRASGDIRPTGSRLPAGGTLVLGLEQDCVGGCWEKGEEFGGEIYGLYILKRRLTSREIKDMYDAGMCDRPVSDPDVVLTWEDFLGAERNGQVQEISAGCSVWDKLNDFVGQTVTSRLIAYLEGNTQEKEKESTKTAKSKKKGGGNKSTTRSTTNWGKILEFFIDQEISQQFISHLKRHHKF